MMLNKKRKEKRERASECNFFTLAKGNAECFSIFQSTQPCFLGSRVVWSIWFLCLWRAISFFGSKVVLFTFLLFLVFPLWWMRVGGSYSHTHIISLKSCHFILIGFFFFFGKLFYFDWLLVLKITLWSYLL